MPYIAVLAKTCLIATAQGREPSAQAQTDRRKALDARKLLGLCAKPASLMDSVQDYKPSRTDSKNLTVRNVTAVPLKTVYAKAKPFCSASLPAANETFRIRPQSFWLLSCTGVQTTISRNTEDQLASCSQASARTLKQWVQHHSLWHTPRTQACGLKLYRPHRQTM